MYLNYLRIRFSLEGQHLTKFSCYLTKNNIGWCVPETYHLQMEQKSSGTLVFILRSMIAWNNGAGSVVTRVFGCGLKLQCPSPQFCHMDCSHSLVLCMHESKPRYQILWHYLRPNITHINRKSSRKPTILASTKAPTPVCSPACQV